MANNNGNRGSAAGGGAVYGLGLIGAVVFYWQTADGLWDHVIGLGQALVWPAFMVYDVLRAVGAS